LVDEIVYMATTFRPGDRVEGTTAGVKNLKGDVQNVYKEGRMFKISVAFEDGVVRQCFTRSLRKIPNVIAAHQPDLPDQQAYEPANGVRNAANNPDGPAAPERILEGNVGPEDLPEIEVR
jgi:hypothetical protein